ncbi:prostatic acid phosphatase-like [Harmonia axyridis]|uniref:prostatic acid phosphatase-like n=1 Tax=Harmonia axyridis TaxID=115357 RepID=UPI001E2759B9|nr:prostatic acid phosphatase-like [Harmonia axyridis]
MWFTYSLFLFFIFAQTANSSDGELLCSIVIFREGNRTPLSIQENDPFKEKWLSEGLGVLTEEGRNKMFSLGQFIQKRYKKELLNSGISNESVSARSVQFNSHIESAQMVLYGLRASLPDSLQIEPIPILTEVPSSDSIMMLDSCPAYDKEVKKCMLEDEAFNHIDEEEKELYNLIQENTKCNCNSFTDINKCTDPLICEDSEGLGLPSWCNETCYNHIMKLLNLHWKLEVSTPKLLNLKLQPFVNEMLGKINRYVQGNETKFQLYLFSSMLYTIPCFMKSIGVENVVPHVPNFGAAIFVELRKVGIEYIINLFYREDEDGEMQKLSIKDCSEDCEYSRLLQIIPPLLKKRRLSCGN